MHKPGTTLSLDALELACGGMKWRDLPPSDYLDDRRTGIDRYAGWRDLEPTREMPNYDQMYDPYIDHGNDFEGGGDWG